jgi:hypothetical protein
MAAVVQDAARKADRVLNSGDSGDRAGSQRWALHDRRVHLDLSKAVEGRTLAGVEQRIVFEDDDGRLDGVQRRAATLENFPAGDCSPPAPIEPGRQTIVFDRPGAAVNDDRRFKLWPHKTPGFTDIPGIAAKLGTTFKKFKPFKSFKPTARFFNVLNDLNRLNYLNRLRQFTK